MLVEWAHFFVNARSDERKLKVTHGEDFEFGVEIIDLMQGDGFGCFGNDGGAKFVRAVMGDDEMEKMEAHLFGGRLKIGPGVELGLKFAPEGIDEFDADGDVTEEFAAFVEGDVEAVFGDMIFPKFAAVVEQGAGEQQVAVEHGINRGESVGGAHHLRGVFDETAASGVVNEAGTCAASETGAEFFEKKPGQSAETRIDQRGDEAQDVGVIGGLKDANLGWTREKFSAFFLGKWAKGEFASVDAEVAIAEKFTAHFVETARRKSSQSGVIGVIAPDPEGQGSGGVEEVEFEKRLAIAGVFLRGVFELQMNLAGNGQDFCGGFYGGQGLNFHKAD